MTPLRQRMIDDMTLHGLKPKTIKAYVPCVARFARYFDKSPTLLGTPEIRAYLLYLTHDKHVSASTYNQYLCALKFLYRITLGREWGLDGLARTRRQTKLPVVLSLEEVTRFLQAVTSLRHRAILMTAYAAGLRNRQTARSPQRPRHDQTPGESRGTARSHRQSHLPGYRHHRLASKPTPAVDAKLVYPGERVNAREDAADGHEDDVDERVFASALHARILEVLLK